MLLLKTYASSKMIVSSYLGKSYKGLGNVSHKTTKARKAVRYMGYTLLKDGIHT